MPFFRNFSTKQPFAWGHHSVNQAACRLAGPGNRPSRQVVCLQGETAEWSRMWMCPRNLTGSTLSTVQKRVIGNDIWGQVLCRYWIHQRMLLTASSPIHKSVHLNRFQCSAIDFLHLCLSWHVTSIFASAPKTNVVPVGLNWYYLQVPSQADHEFVCHMLHTHAAR